MRRILVCLFCLVGLSQTALHAEDDLKRCELREHCSRVTIYVGTEQKVYNVDALFIFNTKAKVIAYIPERSQGATQYYKFTNYSYREFDNHADYCFPIINGNNLITIDLHLERDNCSVTMHFTDFDAYFHDDQGALFPL